MSGAPDPATALRLFEEALEVPEEGRSAWVAEHAEGALRDEVQALLDEERRDADLTPVALPGDLFHLGGAPVLPPGTRVETYEVRELLGAGGMGRVYEALQERPRRRVALKTLTMTDSQEARQRFAFEAELLAHLDHPAIARVHEAGVARVRLESGTSLVPFLAMEYVDGARTVVEYADGEGLDLRQRVSLLERVAHAVHHGHERGVMHRDLKPQNVLVSADGEPKVIDFGIARATSADLDATAYETRAGQLVGTPAYMAPEQILESEKAPDTRVDVYALGAILYELACGRPAFQFSGVSLATMLHTVATEEPTRPRRVDARVPADLEAIVLKAMSRDPDARYDSAAALAEDLGRFARDETVSARAPGALLELKRFARRRRALVASLAVAVVSLVTATVVSLGFAADSRRAALDAERGWQAEREARAEADRYLHGLLESNFRIVFEIAADVARLGGGTRERAAMLQRAVDQLGELEDVVAEDPEALLSTVQAYVVLGNALGGPKSDNVGDRDGARAAYERAQALLERLPGGPAASPLARSQVANALANLEWEAGRLEEALALAEEAADALAPHVPTEPFAYEVERFYAISLNNVAGLLGTLGRDDEALAAFRRRADVVERMEAQAPDHPGLFTTMIGARAGVALATWKAGDPETARVDLAELLERLDREALRGAREADGVRWQRVGLRQPYAEVLIELGRHDDAIREMQHALELVEEWNAIDPGNERSGSDPMLITFNLGWAHLERGKAALAREDGATSATAREDLAAAREHLESALGQFEELEAAGKLRAVVLRNKPTLLFRLREARELLDAQ